MRRCPCFLAFVLATAMLAAGPTAASTSYDDLVQLDNSLSAQPAVSTSSMFSHDTGSNAVTNANLAYFHSFDCTGCRTITVAVQAVVIEGSPSTVGPQNAAVAVNENCQACQTFAYTHHYVFSPHHAVTFDPDTNQKLAYIQSGIDWVAHSNMDFPTMSTRLDQLSWGFCTTVQ